ncbi:MAG: L-seryl-tRNA(Sec) selenium transferase [Planctomycetes bacterium]|nr:L-seryl-tRNA(Sec) selenium transferase [Planctomycetota bacterium]
MVAGLLPMPTSESDRSRALRHLPAVDQILRDERLLALPRAILRREARAWLEELRAGVLAGRLDAGAVAALGRPEACADVLRQRCAAAARPRHARVFNATGIVLHTGLGRAPLADAAVAALVAAARYAVVEVDPATGARDQRETAVARLLVDLTGAGGALVVNNNAAATTLMLAALGEGREVVVSRGELVEIGGGFRMPEVMRRAGCTMVEVGTTNRTHERDFTAATGERTAAWLKVHPSNFRIEGFAGVPSVADLVRLAAAEGPLVLEDLGSGLLGQAPIPGLEHEPRVQDSVAAGAHVVCFSGDKLLGGPQCGILVGRADLIARCRAHPLYRALRCDKLVLAALEATLAIHRDGEPLRDVPTLRLLSAPPAVLRARSEALAELLPGLGAEVVASDSFAGAGANPARPLPSFAVALPGGDAELAALRAARPVAVFARVEGGRVQLDARTLHDEDLAAVAAAVRQAWPAKAS